MAGSGRRNSLSSLSSSLPSSSTAQLQPPMLPRNVGLQRTNNFRHRMLELSDEFERLEGENRALRMQLHNSNDGQADEKASETALRHGARGRMFEECRLSMQAGVDAAVKPSDPFPVTEIGKEQLDLQVEIGGVKLQPVRPSSSTGSSPGRARRRRSSSNPQARNSLASPTTIGSTSEKSAPGAVGYVSAGSEEMSPIISEAQPKAISPLAMDGTVHKLVDQIVDESPQLSRASGEPTVTWEEDQLLWDDKSRSCSRSRKSSLASMNSKEVCALASGKSHDLSMLGSLKSDVSTKSTTAGLVAAALSSVTKKKPQTIFGSKERNGLESPPKTENAGGRQISHHASMEASIKVDSFLPGYLNLTDRDKLDLATNQVLEEDEQEVACCVVGPASKFRVTWDLCMAVLLLYELWVTPFELIFVKEGNMPPAFAHISYGITAFFCIDILLNFNTGFFKKDRTIMTRREIVVNYMRHWFLIDLVSTVPFDLIVASISGGLLRWVRFGKATKLLKTLRYLRLARSISLLASRRGEGNFVQIQKLMVHLRYLSEPIKVVVILVVFSHVHGCLWGLLQPQWAPGATLEESCMHYYRSFRWAYTAITLGLMDPPMNNDAAPFTWMLELIVSSERLCFCALVGIWAVFQSQTRLQDYARITKLKEEALDYLKRHQVSFNTQVQVLYILHETGNARNRQRHFRELMDNDLPLELHRKICSELWCTRLMSLGLITHVAALHDNFLIELAMVVREEVFASKAVIFRYGDAAIASYCVIDGSLLAVHIPGDEKVPEFIVGHWIGETALVSPALRRDMTIVTKRITALMGVPAESFFELLETHKLVDAFEQVCKEHLWRGFCGRCGSFGDHFAETCPMLGLSKPYLASPQLERSSRNTNDVLEDGAAPARTSKNSLDEGDSKKQRRLFASSKGLLGRSREWGSTRKSVQHTIHRDLAQFLQAANLTDLVPTLGLLGVKTLKDLQTLDMDELQATLGPGKQLTEDQQAALSDTSIQKFQESAARTIQRQLFGSPVENSDHYIFLSHSKVEAGTEAALMKEELEKILSEDKNSPSKSFAAPVFLDSDNLTTLSELQATVLKSHNIVVLLTSGVLTRPWVLVEIVTAVKAGVRILPVQVSKPGTQFEFPSEDWYAQLFNGELLNYDGIKVLHEAEVTLREVEASLREMFKQIAVPYSPHRPAEMRKAELTLLMKRLRLKHGHNG